MEVPDILNFKIIVLGFQGTGKSSLVVRYIKGEFLGHYNVNVGVEHSTKIVRVDFGRARTFLILSKVVLKGHCCSFPFIFCRLPLIFRSTESWSDEVKQYAHEEAVYFLIATKADIQDKREVRSEQASAFLRQIGGAQFLETSAKTGLNINSLFKKVAYVLIKKYENNDQLKKLVALNAFGSNNGFKGQGESLMLLRSTIQKELVINRNKKCCE